MQNTIEELELHFKKILKTNTGNGDWDMFLKDLTILNATNDKITLFVVNNFIKDSIETNFLKKIKTIFQDLLKTDIKIELTIEEKIKKKEDDIFSLQIDNSFSSNNKKQNNNLNNKYTFDNFIIGDNNNFAANASIAVANNPGVTYNPILIYGGVGLGKTHLIQAIGNEVLKKFTDKSVIYVSAEDFINDFIGSLEKKKMSQFKEKYRKTDVLLIDDIHFFQKKESTQEELFHTFNALYDNDKQIVFTCDRPVSELKNMADRVKNRFSRGIVIDLQPPTLETRISIIMKKLKEKQIKNPKLQIDYEILKYIAEIIETNVRDLESAFNTLCAYTELTNKKLTKNLAKEKLQELIYSNKIDNFSIDKIVTGVSKYYDITINDLKGKKRTQNITNARHISIYLLRKLTDFSTTEIGSYFNRDHSTIIHGFSRIEQKLKMDSELQSTIDFLTKKISENS